MTAHLVSLLALAWGMAAAQQLQVQAEAEKRDVAVGEPFILQIRVEGTDAPGKPELSALNDFSVEELGGQQTSSESVTVVNNQVQREVRRGYLYSYRLTARKAGALTIPSIPVATAGRTLRTQPIPIRASPPAEDEDFKLRITVSDSRVYVGQPVTLTVTWYVGRGVRDFRFDLPVLSDRRFQFADQRVRIDPDKHLEIVVAGGRVIAEKGVGRLDGREFATVTIKKILIPQEAGTISIAPVSVAGEALRGYERRGPGGFDDILGEDIFQFGRQPVFEGFVAASNDVRLQVRELPRAGRPPDFSGLVGQYRLEAEAKPTEVNVGDPITLTLRLSGPDYLGNVELPPLAQQPSLARDFKIPAEQAAGEIEDGAKKFTQTIRAMDAGVNQVPPIELSYFNPRMGNYEIARTTPIPLTVREARILTAQDAEGAGGEPPGQTDVGSREGGIAHNYEDSEVLLNRGAGPGAWLENPGWLMALGVPPLVYVGLLAWKTLLRRRKDVAERRAGSAFKKLAKRLRMVGHLDSDGVYSALLEALRVYFSDKFGLAAGAVTFRDVKPMLEVRGIPAETIEAVGKLFERCEAGHYAGVTVAQEEPPELVRTALEITQKLERTLP
jgi:hypothetical protein